LKKIRLTEEYWDERYKSDTAGWSLGNVSPPLKEYIDQLRDKKVKILIPGAGFGYEAHYLMLQGFQDTHICEWSETAVSTFKANYPDFPEHQIHVGNFFELQETFDLIIEQTFFCALDPILRKDYVIKMHDLLETGGKLAGLLFNFDFDISGPPFGGSQKEYEKLFSPLFKIKTMARCYNSVAPRSGNELFFILEKI
jgi:thiopurine S-methyltransferase